MTIPRLHALRKHWLRHPRVEWLAATYLGYKPPKPPSQSMEDLFSHFGIVPGQKIVG